jgi:hypothetical protein
LSQTFFNLHATLQRTLISKAFPSLENFSPLFSISSSQNSSKILETFQFVLTFYDLRRRRSSPPSDTKRTPRKLLLIFSFLCSLFALFPPAFLSIIPSGVYEWMSDGST